MRLYVAIDLDALADQFPDGLELAPHITVLYVADIAAGDVGAALAAIAGVVERGAPFDVELGDLGSFEHPEDDVAWVGIVEGEGLHPLRALRRDMLAGLAAAGLGAGQTYPGFVPHATLARLPKGEVFAGAVPTGTQRVDELRVTVDETDMTLALGVATGHPTTIQAWGERADLGKPFIGLSVGKVYNRFTGAVEGTVTPAILAELARVFETRKGLDPVTLDWNHGTANGGKGGPDQSSSLGDVEAVWVEGENLWMRPRLNALGRRVVADHQVREGESTLYPSPEFAVDPRGLRCRATNAVYGYAQLLAVAATPRPAQVASAVTPITLSEHSEHAAGVRESAEAQMDPIEKMKQLRGLGVPESTIAELLGDAYVAPDAGAAGGAAGGGGGGGGGELAEGKPKPGEAPPADKKGEGAGEQQHVAMSEFVAQQVQLAELERQLGEGQKQFKALLAERTQERQAALKAKVETEYEAAVREHRASPAQHFSFTEACMAAEVETLSARTANPKITADEVEKLPKVRFFKEVFGQVRPDLRDLGTVHGHGQRGTDPGTETLETVITKFAEENKIADWLQAEQVFAQRHPQRHAALYRKEGLA